MCLSPGDIIGGHYQIDRRLGQGGFANTYLAKEMCLPDKPLRVVKEIKPLSDDASVLQDVEDRYNREANALYRLGKHDQIPELFAYFQEKGKFYFVQEYIEGHDLSQELTLGRQLSENEVIDLLKDILTVLKIVHEQKIIHRDIKPSNLMRRDQDKKIVLIDFGAAKEISTVTVTAPGQVTKVLGTVGYIPPEQVFGRPQLSSDIYAVGVIGIQAITGLAPSHHIQTDGNNQILWLPWASQISPRLKEILDKMVRFEWKQRYQSVTEVLQDLKDLQALSGKKHTLPILHSSTWQLLRQSAIIRSGSWLLASTVIAIVLLIPIVFNLVNSNKYIITNTNKTIFNSKLNLSTELSNRISLGEKILFYREEINNKNQEFQYKNQKGTEAMADGKYEDAAKYFEDANKKYPNSPETIIYLNNARIAKEKKKAYTIAVAVPIGSKPNEALEVLRGVAQAQNEINEVGGINGVPLKVAIANDDDDPKIAKQIASELAKNTEVLGVVGHYSTDATRVAAREYEAGKLVAISPTSSAIELSNISPYFFRTVPNSNIMAKALVGYMLNKLQQKKAAVFFNSKSEYSKSLKSQFDEEVVANGGEYDKELEFDLSDSTFSASSSLKKAIDKGTQVLMLAPDASTLDRALFVIQLNQKQLKLLGGNEVYSQQTLKDSGKAAVGMVVVVAWHIDGNSGSDFSRRARELWNASVSGRTAMSYDATQALIAALNRAALKGNPTRAGIQQALSASDFSVQGASGTIRFLSSGDRIGSVQLVKVEKVGSSSHSGTGYDFVPVRSN